MSQYHIYQRPISTAYAFRDWNDTEELSKDSPTSKC